MARDILSRLTTTAAPVLTRPAVLPPSNTHSLHAAISQVVHTTHFTGDGQHSIADLAWSPLSLGAWSEWSGRESLRLNVPLHLQRPSWVFVIRVRLRRAFPTRVTRRALSLTPPPTTFPTPNASCPHPLPSPNTSTSETTT